MKADYRLKVLYGVLLAIPIVEVIFVHQHVNEVAIWILAVIQLILVGITWFHIQHRINQPLEQLAHTIKEIWQCDYADVSAGRESLKEKSKQSDETIASLYDSAEQMLIHLEQLSDKGKQYEETTRALISNISHDLKTPLTAIKGYSEGILDGVATTPEKQQKYLKTIYTKATDMTVLIDELSFYAKIDQDQMHYHFVPVNLNTFFSDCISEMTLDMEVKNMNMVFFNYVNPTQQITADVEQLKRVVNNIIGNAVKYIGHSKGMIHVRLSDGTAEDEVEVRIEDNGIGVKEEELPQLFERFYRTDASRNSSNGGSGLGLAIAKKIIEEHGGRIWAEGKYGVGLTIAFTLKKRSEESEY